MKITIIVPSNRPQKLARFLASFPTLAKGDFGKQYHVHISAQVPNNQKDVLRMLNYHIGEKWSLSWHLSANPTKMIMWRYQGMYENKDSDYFLFLDDDHKFDDPDLSKRFRMTCSEYYKTAFEFLEENQDVGVLCLRGSLGGSSWGYKIVKTPTNGLVSTDKGGMIVRNIGINNICEPTLLLNEGALFESVFAYSVMLHGWKNAKRFNAPTKFEAVGSHKHIGNSQVATYSDEVVNANNQKWIREIFNDPNWTHSSKQYPKILLQKFEERGWKFNEGL